MEKPAIGIMIISVFLSAIFLLSNSEAWAWGSYSRSSSSSSYGSTNDSTWGSYGGSNDSSSSSYGGSNDSSWGSSGTSRDGSTSWSSWSYSDNGSSISEEFCRRCHANLDRFPSLRYENPDKHHLLVNKQIPSNSIAPNDTPGDLYECLTCHSVEVVDNAFVMMVTRDCLKCHPINTVTGPPRRSNNVHHRVSIRNCNTCHSVIGF